MKCISQHSFNYESRVVYMSISKVYYYGAKIICRQCQDLVELTDVIKSIINCRPWIQAMYDGSEYSNFGFATLYTNLFAAVRETIWRRLGDRQLLNIDLLHPIRATHTFIILWSTSASRKEMQGEHELFAAN